MARLIFFLLMIYSPRLLASASDELRLEGIVYEQSNPDASMAVVNGAFLKKGDTYGNYRVAEITQWDIAVEPAAGGEKTRLRVVGPAPAPVQAPAASSTPQGAKFPPENLPREFTFNPMGVLNLAWETKAMANLKQISVAAAAYFAETEQMPDLQTLVDRDFLPKTFSDGESGGYRFRMGKGEGMSLEVFADPVNPKSTLRYFMMDHHGVLHFETGKPATEKSPAYMD